MYGVRVHVGRGDELHQLDRACDLHTRRVTVLEGPPGVGKTHLLTELAERARARGLRVLTIRATEFEAAVPFGLIGDLLDSPVVPVDPREMARRLALPLTETPTLLIVDDLHWADAASLAVL